MNNIIEFVKQRNYTDATSYIIAESKPNPWLTKPNASHHEVECSLHPHSECVVIKLHEVYYNKWGAALVAESACGHLQIWMD